MQNKQIAERIKSICKENRVSLTSLIAACSLSKSFIYDLEKRNKTPSVSKLNQIADYLNCSVDYLLGRTDNPNSITNGNISNSSVAQASGSNNRISIQSKSEYPYSEVIEHLDNLSPVERRHAIADLMDVLENQYPIKKK